MLGRAGLLSVFVILSAIYLHFFQPDFLTSLWRSSENERENQKFLPLKDGEVLLTAEELSTYTGELKKSAYLAILGRIYDVSSGMQHYGPDGGYHQFTAKDASRSFISGDFSPKGLTDDLSNLSPQQMLAIDNWVKFYEKDYKYVGRLIGRYYDVKGQPTESLREAMKVIDLGLRQSEIEAEEKRKFPGCNSEWSEQEGGRIWCSSRSGGIERDWTGVPRQLFNPSTGDTKCVCVHPSQLDNPNLREYPGCATTSVTCPLPK